jgi:hypothetical protein
MALIAASMGRRSSDDRIAIETVTASTGLPTCLSRFHPNAAFLLSGENGTTFLGNCFSGSWVQI